MSEKKLSEVFTCLALCLFSTVSEAGGMSVIESRPLSEFWVNPGFFSYHFQRDKGLTGRNIGAGGEYRYSTTGAITLGVYENSVRTSSRYLGCYWQPLALGPARLGVVAGAIDGYPRMHNGSWYLAVIPVASIENKRVGANILIVPSYQDKIYGAISVQLKFKLF